MESGTPSDKVMELQVAFFSIQFPHADPCQGQPIVLNVTFVLQ